MKNQRKLSVGLILFIVILALSAINSSYAVGVIGTIHVGTSPYDLAYDSGKGEIFETNSHNTVSVISDTSNKVVQTINVGNNPIGVAYDSGKSEIFVANSYSGTVSVINDASLLSPSPSPTASATPTTPPFPTPSVPEFPLLTITSFLMLMVVADLLIYFKKQKQITKSQT